MQMYKEGVEKVEQGLDMVKIIKMNIENSAALRATIMDLKMNDFIAKSDQLVI